MQAERMAAGSGENVTAQRHALEAALLDAVQTARLAFESSADGEVAEGYTKSKKASKKADGRAADKGLEEAAK
eukprot:6311684-Prymnesium_polylepis.1